MWMPSVYLTLRGLGYAVRRGLGSGVTVDRSLVCVCMCNRKSAEAICPRVKHWLISLSVSSHSDSPHQTNHTPSTYCQYSLRLTVDMSMFQRGGSGRARALDLEALPGGRECPYPVAAGGAESTREKRSECDSAPCRLSVFSVCVVSILLMTSLLVTGQYAWTWETTTYVEHSGIIPHSSYHTIFSTTHHPTTHSTSHHTLHNTPHSPQHTTLSTSYHTHKFLLAVVRHQMSD